MAKTKQQMKEQAREAYDAIAFPARHNYSVIRDSARNIYRAIREPA